MARACEPLLASGILVPFRDNPGIGVESTMKKVVDDDPAARPRGCAVAPKSSVRTIQSVVSYGF